MTTTLAWFGFVTIRQNYARGQVVGIPDSRFHCEILSLILAAYSLISKMVFSFETEFGPHQKELERLSAEVQAEISLAAAQNQKQEFDLQEAERQAASLGRKMLTMLTRSVQQSDADAKSWALELNRREMEKARRKALDALSGYDHLRTYKQLRRECVPGTSAWICETSEFERWMTGSEKTLWCTGKRSLGKDFKCSHTDSRTQLDQENRS